MLLYILVYAHVLRNLYIYIYIQMKNKLLSLQNCITIAKCILINQDYYYLHFQNICPVIINFHSADFFLFPYVFPPVMITKWWKNKWIFPQPISELKKKKHWLSLLSKNLKTQFHSTRKKHKALTLTNLFSSHKTQLTLRISGGKWEKFLSVFFFSGVSLRVIFNIHYCSR